MGPEVRRQYHSAGRRLQTEINQQHFRVVAQGGEHDGQEAVVGAGILVRAVPGERGGRGRQAWGARAAGVGPHDRGTGSVAERAWCAAQPSQLPRPPPAPPATLPCSACCLKSRRKHALPWGSLTQTSMWCMTTKG